MTRTPATQIDRLKYARRSGDILELLRLARRLMFLGAVMGAAGTQLFWNLYQIHGFDASRLTTAFLAFTATCGLICYAPRIIGLPYWPTMTLIQGLTICGFIFLATPPSALFALALLAALPAIVLMHLAVWYITRPMPKIPDGEV